MNWRTNDYFRTQSVMSKRGDLIVLRIYYGAVIVYFSPIFCKVGMFLFPFYGKGKTESSNKFIQDHKTSNF